MYACFIKKNNQMIALYKS